ncbi:MAG: hypothetical protein ACR2LG_03095 [Actinomycetota bacterium]|nr:hypothetical protein [Actinomycetota bacterium]
MTTSIPVVEFVAQPGSTAPASPTPTSLQAPPAEPLEIAGAILAIALALAAAILGYRIIRGGRGL